MTCDKEIDAVEYLWEAAWPQRALIGAPQFELVAILQRFGHQLARRVVLRVVVLQRSAQQCSDSDAVADWLAVAPHVSVTAWLAWLA